MKTILFFALLICTSATFAQKLKFKVEGLKDTTVFLTKYYGKGLYYADTAESKGGYAEFTAKPDLKPGIVAFLMPGQKYFEFIFNKEEVNIETSKDDLIGAMKVKKSEENKIFNGYIQFIQKERTKANEITKAREKLKKDDSQYAVLGKQLDSIGKSVLAYQTDLFKNNPDKLVAKLIKMSIEIDVPEAPKDANGKILDSNFRYNYYRAHYWDNIDLKDDRLVNTPVFHQKLETYFGKTMLVQHPDTITKFAFPFCDQLTKGSDLFKYSVDYITNNAAKSNIMGLDKVFVLMVERYYCAKDEKGKSYAYWMGDEKLKELCDENPIKKKLVQGVVPPNVSLRDTTDKVFRDFYSLKSEYTILYFWDPDCGHCKKVTPKLETLYSKKFKGRNIEVFAVGKATGEEFLEWKKFIKDNKLTFINVGLTQSLYEAATKDALQFIPKYTTLEALNYHTTYDLYATPRIFVLDKDKKIIAKQLTISQLEDLLDNLQKIKNPEKLFPPDPEDEAH